MEISNGIKKALLYSRDAAVSSHSSNVNNVVSVPDLLSGIEKMIQQNDTYLLENDMKIEISNLARYLDKHHIDREYFNKLKNLDVFSPSGSIYPVSVLLDKARIVAMNNGESQLTLLRLFFVIRNYENSGGDLKIRRTGAAANK